MSRADYETEIAVMPNGNIYAGVTETTFENKVDVAATHPHARIGKFVEDKNVHDQIVLKARLQDHYTHLADSYLASGGSMALSALSPGVNQAENLQHIQLIRLYPEVQGKPIDYFFLERAFTTRQVPKLELRETWQDTVSNAQYLDRLQPADEIQTPFGEIKYDLKKLVDVVYTPIEDMYRTMMNPEEINIAQVRFSMKKERNKAALKAIQQIGNAKTINNMKAFVSGEGFHSRYNPANEINTLINDFVKTNDVAIDTIIMNPETFQDYTSNTWTLRGPTDLQPKRMPIGGVAPMPGLEGITAVVDVEVPDHKLYAINKANALRLGEGPKLVKRFHDNDRQADAIKFTDFHEHIAVNSQLTLARKYGMTITEDSS